MEAPFHAFIASYIRLLWLSRRRFAETDHQRGGAFLPFRIWHIESGSAVFHYGGDSLRLGPGSWAFVPPRFEEQRIAQGTVLTTLGVSWECPDGRQPLQGIAPGLLERKRRNEIAACVDALLACTGAEEVQPGGDHRFETARVNLADFTKFQQGLWRLLEAVVRHGGRTELPSLLPEPPDPRAARLWAFLRECGAHAFPEKTGLERRFGIGWRRLEQLFKTGTGVTPRQFHDRLRLERARSLLLDPSLSVKQIAFRLGFSSVSGFSQWFKARQKSGPAQYRAQA